MSLKRSAVSLAADFRSGKLDTVAFYRENYFRQFQKWNNTIHAFTYFDEEVVLREIAELETLLRNDDVFYGVPVGVKDIFNTREMPTQMGSPLWKGFTPGNDARVIYNYKRSGAVTFGKTVTAEFAVHTPNETRNPWNTEHSPGTSSSGSAAAVAAGIVPISLGTQTAGSVIRPASYCGVFGFKPSFGLLPRTAMLKTTDSLDTIGFFTSNFYDCRPFFDSIRVKGLDYPVSDEKLNNKAFQSRSGANWKIALITDQLDVCSNYNGYAKDGLESFAAKIASNDGFELHKAELPEILNSVHGIQKIIYHKALSYYFKKEYANYTLVSEVMRDIIEEGLGITTEQYIEALDKQFSVSSVMDSFFEEYDAIITLSTSGTAPEFGVAIDPPDTSLIWTFCGLPTISLPVLSHDGLPLGVQVVSRKYADYKLLGLVSDLVDAGVVNECIRFADPELNKA